MSLDGVRSKSEDCYRDDKGLFVVVMAELWRTKKGGEALQNPIDEVLQAEQQAERETDRHRDDARKTINQAMQTARLISERANQRISNVRSHCAASVKVTCDEMWRAYDAEPKTVIDDLATAEHIAAVSKRVAGKLTGGRDD